MSDWEQGGSLGCFNDVHVPSFMRWRRGARADESHQVNPTQLWWQQPGQRRPPAEWSTVQGGQRGGGSLSCLQVTKRQVMVA